MNKNNIKTKIKESLKNVSKYFMSCNSGRKLVYKIVIFSIVIFAVMMIVFLLRERFTNQISIYGTNTIIDNSGFINIVFIYNTGIGFSALSDNTALVYFVQALIMVVILIWLLFVKNLEIMIPLSLIISGSLSNIIDRATSANLNSDFPNAVLDYFQFWFGGAVFNFADSSIVCGFIILVISYVVQILIQFRKESKMKKENLAKNDIKNMNNVKELKEIDDETFA